MNGKTPSSTAAYLRELPTVVFSPLDIALARGSKDLRRRYLDRAAFLADPSHLSALRSYNRVLKQRNAALRSGTRELDVWDQQLAQYGAVLHTTRRSVLESIGPIVRDLHRQVAGVAEDVEMTCSPRYEDSATEALLQQLESSRARESKVGYTTVGPHRDSLNIRLDGKNLDQYASQGQMRTVALSMKLAMLLWGERVQGQAPLFLLDDPGSELDSGRLGFLGEFLTRWSGQVWITGTERDSLPLPGAAKADYYRVWDGAVTAA